MTKEERALAILEERAKRRADWCAANKEKLAVYQRQYRETNKDKLQAQRDNNKEHRARYYKEWCKANRDKKRSNQKRYVENNKDKVREYKREWLRRNPEILAERSKAYRRKVNKRPAWQTKYVKEFVAIRKKARSMSRETGIQHDVDHIIPLVNTKVCGLNVPWNLQIIPRSDNNAKSNRWDGTYENKRWWNGST